MSNPYKCKQCGGSGEERADDGVWPCSYCNEMQTLRAMYFDEGYAARNSEVVEDLLRRADALDVGAVSVLRSQRDRFRCQAAGQELRQFACRYETLADRKEPT